MLLPLIALSLPRLRDHSVRVTHSLNHGITSCAPGVPPASRRRKQRGVRVPGFPTRASRVPPRWLRGEQCVRVPGERRAHRVGIVHSFAADAAVPAGRLGKERVRVARRILNGVLARAHRILLLLLLEVLLLLLLLVKERRVRHVRIPIVKLMNRDLPRAHRVLLLLLLLLLLLVQNGEMRIHRLLLLLLLLMLLLMLLLLLLVMMMMLSELHVVKRQRLRRGGLQDGAQD